MERQHTMAMEQVRFSLSLLHLVAESHAHRLERLAEASPMASPNESAEYVSFADMSLMRIGSRRPKR